MFCSKCGKNVSDEAKFCDGCGTPVGEGSVREYIAATQEYSENSYNNNQSSNTQPSYAASSAAAQPQQSYYGPNSYASQPMAENDKPLTVGNYLVMMILASIPIVGIILILVWAFGGNVNRNKKNWAIATIIMFVIVSVLSLIFGSIIAVLIESIFSSF